MKPEMFTFYDKMKGGIDVVGKLCFKYDFTQNTKQWAMFVFFLFLNIPSTISFIVYEENNKHKISQRNFLRGLGIELKNDRL